MRQTVFRQWVGIEARWYRVPGFAAHCYNFDLGFRWETIIRLLADQL